MSIINSIALLSLRVLRILPLFFAFSAMSQDVCDSVVPQLSWADSLRQRLTPFAAESEKAHFFSGILVYDLTDDSVLYDYNSQKLMRPASNQKVLTAVTALTSLGKNYCYRTSAYYSGNIIGDTTFIPVLRDSVLAIYEDSAVVRNVLRGNIYVVGGFDPAFTTSDLKDFALSIKSLGIDSIAGQIVGDVSMKDTLHLGNGWCWDDVPSAGIPYLTPLLFNHEAIVGGSDKKCTPYPERYFVQFLAMRLREQGIGMPFAPTRISTIPTNVASSVKICEKTRTVEQILQQMMKDSDNLYAESMFYLTASRRKSSGISWKDGAKEVEDMVRRAGASTDYLVVADGSGVSLYNYVTPRVEVAALRYAYRNPEAYKALYNAMPIAGVDGTLQKRMVKGPARGNVHAKTGTVSGVSTLTGYVRASNGHLLAFSIMNNGLVKAAVGRDFQDRVCQELAR